MTFKTINKPFFYISLFVFFVLYLSFDVVYQLFNIGLGTNLQISMFMFLKNIAFWVLFWWVLDKGFAQKRQVFFVGFISIAFTSLPLFLYNNPIRLDYDNLVLKSVCYFFGFLLISILFFKGFKGRLVMPIFMGLIPLINLTLANGFTGNLSFLYPFFHKEINQIVLSNHLTLDWGLAIANTFFFSTLVVLFIEVLNFSFTIKSIQAEAALKKQHFILIVFSFKTIIYWLLATLLINFLGNNSIQLFTNKLGALLYGFGAFAYISIAMLFLRRYITNYFYDKIGTNNWLFALFFLPFFDILGILLILFFPFHLLKSKFNKGFSRQIIVYALAIILSIYAILNYVFVIKDLPSSASDFKLGLILLNIVFPVITFELLIFSLKKPMFYSILIAFFIVMLPIVYVYIIPKIEPSGNLNLLVNSLNVYFQTSLLVFFVYPILYLKSFVNYK
jgi:hypothetical protein